MSSTPDQGGKPNGAGGDPPAPRDFVRTIIDEHNRPAVGRHMSVTGG